MLLLNYCSYNINLKAVNAEKSLFIKPSISLSEIDDEFLKENDLTKANLENTFNLQETINSFNKFLFDEYISNDLKFAFITKNDSLIGEQLFKETKIKGIILPNYYSSYLNLIEEYKAIYNTTLTNEEDLNDILKQLNLKPTEKEPNDRASFIEIKTLVRIVNRIVRDGKSFRTLNKNLNERAIEEEENNGLLLNGSSNINDSFKNSTLSYKYCRIKHLESATINKEEIKDILFNYNILDSDINLSYDIYGRKTGQACFRIDVSNNNNKNFAEIITSLT